MSRRSTTTLALGLGLLAAGAATAAPVQDWTRTETRDDCVAYNALRSPFFGETHIHTSHSLDATFVRVRSTPRDAYEFAKGAPIGLPPYDEMDQPTRTAQLRRPLRELRRERDLLHARPDRLRLEPV
jgi:hypothetical protein